MEVSNWIALAAVVMSFLALVISGLAYSETKRTADANVSMAESNERMARSNEEAVRLAREAADYERGVYRKSLSASFTFRRGPTTTSGERVEFQAVLHNEGPHSALDVEPSLERQGQPYAITSGAGTRHEVPAGQSLTVSYGVQRAEMESGQAASFVHRLRYRDGNGQREQAFRVRYSGNVHAGWSAEAEDESNETPAGG